MEMIRDFIEWISSDTLSAFATIFPNYEILVFFILPVRVKWLALLSLAPVVFFLIEGSNGVRAAIAVAFGNYLLFFAGHLVGLARGQQLQLRQAARRASFRPPPEREGRGDERACAICGAQQADGADIRVCSCEKCGTPRQLCLEHARNH